MFSTVSDVDSFEVVLFESILQGLVVDVLPSLLTLKSIVHLSHVRSFRLFIVQSWQIKVYCVFKF